MVCSRLAFISSRAKFTARPKPFVFSPAYPMPDFFSDEDIRNQIYLIRRHRVMLLPDLARLYAVSGHRLFAQAERFPCDFCFPLERCEIVGTTDEPAALFHRLYAFTEHGMVAAAFLLATPRAMAMCAQVLRAFRQVRQTAMALDSPVTAGTGSFSPARVAGELHGALQTGQLGALRR